jgi:hypothetical protein
MQKQMTALQCSMSCADAVHHVLLYALPYAGDESFADSMYAEAVQRGLVQHWSSTHYLMVTVDGSLQGYVHIVHTS